MPPSADQQPPKDISLLQNALAALQATASYFSITCITDSQIRMQYARDVQTMSRELRHAIDTGILSARQAAEQANMLRNHIMDLSRLRSSPMARAYAAQLKQNGKSFSALTDTYAERLFGASFESLAEGQQTAVYAEIVMASGRANPSVTAITRFFSRAGRRLAFVSLAVAIYEISAAEDKPREIARQGTLAGVGVAGGWMAGAGAVSAGACAATAPICVGIAALVGGLLFALGADLTFDTLYPRPSHRAP